MDKSDFDTEMDKIREEFTLVGKQNEQNEQIEKKKEETPLEKDLMSVLILWFVIFAPLLIVSIFGGVLLYTNQFFRSAGAGFLAVLPAYILAVICGRIHAWRVRRHHAKKGQING